MNDSDFQASGVSGIQQSLPRSDTSRGTLISSIGCAVQLSEKCTNLNDDLHEAEFHVILNSGRLSVKVVGCRSQVTGSQVSRSLVVGLREHRQEFL